MPNIYVSTNAGSAPQSVAVGTSSGTLIVKNVNRAGLVIINTSSSTMYLAFDGLAATLNAGIVLTPNGGAFSMDDYTFTRGTIKAIAHVALSNAAVQEFYIGI